MRLLLVRHGESTWNATARWQGQSDVPLSPRGQLQVRALARRLYGRRTDQAFCSDLSRAYDTAVAIQPAVDPDERFREIDVGEWAGMKRADVAVRFADQVAALRAGEPVRIGGGESMAEFEARVDAATDELRARYPGQDVLLVTHGGVIRAAATRALDLRGRPSPLVGVANASISVLEDLDGELRLRRYNDAVHLDPADQGSAIIRSPVPITRVALVACAGERSGRRLADLLLSGLGIPRYYATDAVMEGELAQHLGAEPLGLEDPSAAFDRLVEEHRMSVFALVLPPEAVRSMAARRLGLSGGGTEALAAPEHGSVAQLRITERSTTLHSWGVTLESSG